MISLTLRGEEEKLNTGISLLKLSSGGLSEGLISFTIAEEMEVKKSLNKFAISAESITVQLFTIRLEIDNEFSDFLFIASLIKFQVCLTIRLVEKQLIFEVHFFGCS